MGAIKEGDDPADYKYEWNPKVAIPVGLAGGTMVTFATATLLVGGVYYLIFKVQDLTRGKRSKRKSNFLPLRYTTKTQSGKRIKGLRR